VQLCKAKLGKDYPNTLLSIYNLAAYYSNTGQQLEALQLIEQVVQLCKAKLGKDYPSTLYSIHSLAIWYSEAG